MAQSINFADGSIGGSTSLTPAPGKSLSNSNYLSNSDYTFAQQYLPDLYEKEFERYGNRSISSFLRMVGAEIPSSSDLIKWSEQGRLHIQDSGTINGAGNIDGLTSHNFRDNQTIIVSNADASIQLKCLITDASGANDIDVVPFAIANLTASGGFTDNDAVTIFVYGSEFKKGTTGMSGSLDADFDSKENNPIIIKDKYEVSGSEMAHVGWVEVTTENGANGFLWYLKSEHETRLRFEDYLEMSMVEGEKAASGSGAIGAGYKGTEGLFAALESRGNIYQNFNSGEAALTGSTTRTALQDFDEILKNLDKQGAIEENMLFLQRNTALAFDDMLGAVNAHYNGGTSFGVFNNSEDMALNLGFSGFRRGSYDFYKTDWKYLNDAATRGLTEDIDGVLVPAGTSTVYDQQLGKNIKRPFLHIRYRASEADDRKMKSWITGSVGGVYTTDKDEMNVHFLSERCLCVQGANNFVLFKSVTQA